jgi:translation initiation factor IF-1
MEKDAPIPHIQHSVELISDEVGKSHLNNRRKKADIWILKMDLG